MSQLTISIVGFSRPRAELLAEALRRAKPGAFSFVIIDDPLDSIGVDRIADSMLLISSSRPEQSAVIKAGRQLRSQSFYWQPIHLLVESPVSLLPLGKEWAIWPHQLPPNVSTLAEAMISSGPVAETRRTEIVISALSALADDLSTFSRSHYSKSPIEPDRIKRALSKTLLELSEGESTGKCVELRLTLEKLTGLPMVADEDLQKLMPLVVNAEMQAREEKDQQGLAAMLHKLNNTLRLALWQPRVTDELAEKIRCRLIHLQQRGVRALPEDERGAVESLCTKLSHFLEEFKDGKENSQVDDYIYKLNKQILARRALMTDGERDISIARIVVVEDDPDWMSQILGTLKAIVGDYIEIQKAETITQARELLEDSRPALVLVDLGLPLEEGADLVLDGGLGLIKDFSESDNRGRRFLHRFVVLTAAENYAEAVRDALEYGISPFSYLQKDPRSWVTELQAQVRLALQPQSTRLPTIEIFKRTRRIARVEGVEIKLSYPHWCLLAALAASRKGMWNEAEKLAHILYWNYSVNPDSRSVETGDLDPEERILDQLPHYTSELNLQVAEVYLKSAHRPLPVNIVSSDPEAGYRLNANARVLDQVDEHFSEWRRPSVLVVEDNPEWANEIVTALKRYGFETRVARWIDEAKSAIADELPDLMSLDLELPKTKEDWARGAVGADSSIEFLGFIRENHIYCPVAVLTGIPWRDRVMLEMLRRGVRIDDYLSKGWENPTQRLANSLTRLWQETVLHTRILDWNPSTPAHPITIDPQSKLLTAVGGFSVRPSGKGCVILQVLSASPNVFVSRAELIESLFSDFEDGPEDLEKALDQHIKRLRKSIKDATGGSIPGDEVICSDRGVYWLRGIVQ